jgi:hypothetical protein
VILPPLAFPGLVVNTERRQILLTKISLFLYLVKHTSKFSENLKISKSEKKDFVLFHQHLR